MIQSSPAHGASHSSPAMAPRTAPGISSDVSPASTSGSATGSSSGIDPGIAIDVRNLTHRYGRRTIYENLNLSVNTGKVVALLGKNGVGKTTLIKILMGFLAPVSGECRVLGDPSHALSPKTRQRVGLLFEGHVAYDFMTIAQVERFYAPFYPNWRKDFYFELVGKLGLPDTHRIAHMSEGQRSQVVLGLLMAQQPELLILDDYSMGLDAGYRRLFLDMLGEYLAGGARTVFLTSHVIQDLEHMGDELIFLERGGQVRQFALKDFLCSFRRFRLPKAEGGRAPRAEGVIKNVEEHAAYWELYAFGGQEQLTQGLCNLGYDPATLQPMPMTLEDAFIGYTGRY